MHVLPPMSNPKDQRRLFPLLHAPTLAATGAIREGTVDQSGANLADTAKPDPVGML
jgi:hypothetical protein